MQSYEVDNIMRLETAKACRKVSILSPRIKGVIIEYDAIMKNAKIFDNWVRILFLRKLKKEVYIW